MRATVFYLSMLQKYISSKPAIFKNIFQLVTWKKKKKNPEKQKQKNKQTNKQTKKGLNKCVYNFSVDYRTFDNVLKEYLSDH